MQLVPHVFFCVPQFPQPRDSVAPGVHAHGAPDELVALAAVVVPDAVLAAVEAALAVLEALDAPPVPEPLDVPLDVLDALDGLTPPAPPVPGPLAAAPPRGPPP